MSKTILFLCPHHAAKSVIAEVYFNRLAEQAGLPCVGISAGTEPDERVMPSVEAMLRGEGINVSEHQPRRVTRDELSAADRVISMGCALSDLEVTPEAFEVWSDVPMVSQDLPAARAAILQHVEKLVAELEQSSTPV
jgi:protein-tyrosine-phosphatase